MNPRNSKGCNPMNGLTSAPAQVKLVSLPTFTDQSAFLRETWRKSGPLSPDLPSEPIRPGRPFAKTQSLVNDVPVAPPNELALSITPTAKECFPRSDKQAGGIAGVRAIESPSRAMGACATQAMFLARPIGWIGPVAGVSFKF